MNWLLDRLVGRKPDLTSPQMQRLAAWQALPPPRQNTPFNESRYVVVDVESSGLNISRDRLIAIGAVAVANGRIRLDDSFEIVLQQAQVSEKDNILIHGIGGTHTNTLQRLREIALPLNISTRDVDAYCQAFLFIQLLRLRLHHVQSEQGTTLTNRVDPDTLNNLDQRILKEAFRQARKLQIKLGLDYQA